jgi:ParB family transcriptional regulator, chromosome partitioning protein
MTDTTTETTDTVDGASPPAPTVEYVDPSTVLLDANVRLDARLDKDFVASIRDNGVLVPARAVRTADGQLRIRFGSRRALAAIETGQQLPVLVVADEGTDDAATVERIIQQWAENEHRAGLTVAEKVGVVGQLSLLGVSAAQITKKTKFPRQQVDQALTVSKSKLATAALERYDFLDLVQAAAVAEFAEAGDKESVTRLVAAAQTGQFDHTLQLIRDEQARAAAQAERDRKETERRQRLEAELRAAGITIIDPPTIAGVAKTLDDLRTPDGHFIEPEDHAGCPGHAAYLDTVWGYIDHATGEPVDRTAEDDEEPEESQGEEGEDERPDEGAEDFDEGYDPEELDPDDEGDGGDEETRDVRWGQYLGVKYACTDPAANGHVTRASLSRPTAPRVPAAEQSEAERAEAAATRRDVIDSNKAWDSAQKVRRNWLKGLFARKSAPKGSPVFVATALALDGVLLGEADGNHLTATLIGVGSNELLAAEVSTATDGRANLLTLAQVLGAYEAHTDRNDWRNQRPATVRYLLFLKKIGYDLSPVERRATGEAVTLDGEPVNTGGTDSAGADEPEDQEASGT